MLQPDSASANTSQMAADM